MCSRAGRGISRRGPAFHHLPSARPATGNPGPDAVQLVAQRDRAPPAGTRRTNGATHSRRQQPRTLSHLAQVLDPAVPAVVQSPTPHPCPSGSPGYRESSHVSNAAVSTQPAGACPRQLPGQPPAGAIRSSTSKRHDLPAPTWRTAHLFPTGATSSESPCTRCPPGSPHRPSTGPRIDPAQVRRLCRRVRRPQASQLRRRPVPRREVDRPAMDTNPSTAPPAPGSFAVATSAAGAPPPECPTTSRPASTPKGTRHRRTKSTARRRAPARAIRRRPSAGSPPRPRASPAPVSGPGTGLRRHPRVPR